MKIRHFLLFAAGIFLFAGNINAQIGEERRVLDKQKVVPKPIDFSQIFKQETTREDLEAWNKKREAKIKERLAQAEALEVAVNPDDYIVGPGDIFSFNIWGSLPYQLPLTVTPEGHLSIPSVGEITVSGRTLSHVQDTVLKEASPFYENSTVTLNLLALRFFRVHVLGEVQYPGIYIAQAMDRFSEMINRAGGITQWAWKRNIEVRHPDGTNDLFDLSQYEQDGNLEQNLYVGGGDVLYVPPLILTDHLITVEGDLENSGTYQIQKDETLINFLKRIRGLKRNTDISKIIIIRSTDHQDSGVKEDKKLAPFLRSDSTAYEFSLKSGDRIILPSQYVYVKGSVRYPGAFPYIKNTTARDYAGMAGGDIRSAHIRRVKVYHVRTEKTEKGPNVLVDPGDVVDLGVSLGQSLEIYLRILPAITSLILAAQAAGIFGN